MVTPWSSAEPERSPVRWPSWSTRIRSPVSPRITGIVAEAGANIDEVHHQRAFSSLSVQNVEVELVLQTRNHAHVQDLVARLAAAGFEAAAA